MSGILLGMEMPSELAKALTFAADFLVEGQLPTNEIPPDDSVMRKYNAG